MISLLYFHLRLFFLKQWQTQMGFYAPIVSLRTLWLLFFLKQWLTRAIQSFYEPPPKAECVEAKSMLERVEAQSKQGEKVNGETFYRILEAVKAALNGKKIRKAKKYAH